MFTFMFTFMSTFMFTFMARRGAILCARPIKWLPATNAPALLTQRTAPQEAVAASG